MYNLDNEKNETDNNKFVDNLFSSIEVDIVLGRLSPIERRVIELKSEGLSNRSIAKELNISQKKVADKLFGAKNKIKKLL